jgi:hypothetical protein
MENLSLKKKDKFLLINNTNELLEFKLNVFDDNENINNNNKTNKFNFDFNKTYSLYPDEKFEEEFLLNKNEPNIYAKFYFDYGNIIRNYVLDSNGNYSFEQEAFLKDLKTNKNFGKFSVKFSLRNVTENPIDVRVSSNGIGSDQEFIINKFVLENWERYAGEIIVQIREKNSIYKYKVNCPGNFFYKGNGIFVDKNLSYRNDKSLKFEKDIGAVVLRNNSGLKINVRFSTNGMGSDSFWPINHNNAEAWNRYYGNVYLEIKIDNKTSYQYNVEVPNKYVFNGNGILLEEFTNKEISIVLDAKF